ncbi:hypothetical protein MRX96_004049 [Rhipicephalus microplus]
MESARVYSSTMMDVVPVFSEGHPLDCASEVHVFLFPVRTENFIGIWVASHGYEWTVDVDSRNPAEVPHRIMGKHGAKMGVISQDCDDGQNHIDVDFGGSPEEYTCTMKDLLWYVSVGGWYRSLYKCRRVKKRISSKDIRPLWPVYGEYKYVPPQRWLHSIEHGAVVMLYHPCAPTWFVEKLRKLVRDCLRKHIITPYRRLSLERPLALVAWGCKLQMSHVNAREVIKFIKASPASVPLSCDCCTARQILS